MDSNNVCRCPSPSVPIAHSCWVNLSYQSFNFNNYCVMTLTSISLVQCPTESLHVYIIISWGRSPSQLAICPAVVKSSPVENWCHSWGDCKSPKSEHNILFLLMSLRHSTEPLTHWSYKCNCTVINLEGITLKGDYIYTPTPHSPCTDWCI